MKHIKLFEQFINEYQEPIFQIDLNDLKVGDKVEWYGGEGNYRKLRATGVVKKIKSGVVEITDLENIGTKVMALKGTVIDDNTRLFRVGPGGKLNNWRVVESKLYEYSSENFTAKKIDRKDAIKPNVLAKILFRASKTAEEAEERILSFNGTAMATHVVYYIVKPNGNRPDRPTYRIHVEQYYKWRPNDPKVNVSKLYILKLKEGGNAFNSQGGEWDELGRAYVDTDMLTDDLNRTLEVLKRVS